jgi:transcriptional regulator with XRE-family HTH domain
MTLLLGSRIREERTRLGKNQAELAAEIGIAKKSQTNYELGHSAPNAEYLAAVAGLGMDVLYVLTGNPSPTLQGDELELLRRYRSAPAAVRVAVMAGLGAVVVGVTNGSPAITGGEQGQVVMGSQTNHAPQTFNVGGKKGTKK